jgi:hypothetical protein
MATTFKDFTSSDVVNTKTLLNEVIPLTGTIVSGTYADANIKNYAHGIFQSVYDYPYLSSSANHIFDLTFGYAATSSFSSSANTQNDKKINIYNQMAQVLVGYNTSGSIQRFDQNGDLSEGNKIDESFVFSFARLLTKDEIKKGSFTISLGTANAYATPFTTVTTIGDYGAASEYRTNSPAGEYGILYTSSATPNSTSGVGLIYYQAGVAILSASVFGSSVVLSGSSTRNAVLTGSTIQAIANSVRNRIQNIQFNNTTELNSTIYFCRANHNEYNYSSNPTYVSSSKIVVKNEASDPPIAYITTVGLYSADNELMAVAKLSEPLKKSVDNEIVIRTRLDY